jgi:hypothetical protein
MYKYIKMMNPRLANLCKGYLGTFALIGFYRGWDADNTIKYDQRIEKTKYKLFTDKYISKFCRGIFNGLYYSTFGHFVALHRTIGRAEIFLFDKNPYEHKPFFTECFDFTNLEPEQN